jgi:predicted flap endonuclease-1-like 5' DNA nuclease
MQFTQNPLDDDFLLALGKRADMARVKGIGWVYADLLESAGVDTTAVLAACVPAHLFARLKEAALQLSVRRFPRLEDVEDWGNQARMLERVVLGALTIPLDCSRTDSML